MIESPSAPDVRTAHPFRGPGAVLAALTAVAALLAVAWWWSHPDAFRDDGSGMNVRAMPVARSALTVTVTYPVHELAGKTVTFSGARALLGANTARANASFSICRHRPGSDQIGAVRGDLSEWCDEVQPLQGTRMTLDPSPEGDYVVVTLTPARAGTVRLRGVELDYGFGWGRAFQRGTDRVRMDVRVNAR